jgi:hypothetical protein
VNKDIVIVVFLVLAIGAIYINNEYNMEKEKIQDNALLYEEAKFYGVNIDQFELSNNEIDLKKDMYVEEARFWGVQQAF